MTRDTYKDIQNLMTQNTRERGMANLVLEEDLLEVARGLYQSESVVIVTGFCVPNMNIGETDGPLGALSLAYALKKLKKEVLIVTDDYSEKLIEVGMKSIGLEVELISVGRTSLGMSDNANLESQLFERFKADYIIAIERPGRHVDGLCYNMCGKDVTAFVPNTDFIFSKAKALSIKTASIGDGGNEVGMGKISEYIKEHVPYGQKIYAEIATDFLIISGTSNWGAHALSGVLSLLEGTILMYDDEVEIRALKTIVEAGAVDGKTMKNKMTVDGLSTYQYIRIFNQLRLLIQDSLEGQTSN